MARPALKTEVLLAIDESDDCDSDNDSECDIQYISRDTIEESVTKVLDSVIDSVDTTPKLDDAMDTSDGQHVVDGESSVPTDDTNQLKQQFGNRLSSKRCNSPVYTSDSYIPLSTCVNTSFYGRNSRDFSGHSKRETYIRPVDDIEDVDNLEVNICNNDSDDDDMEGEDCMIIDDMYSRMDREVNKEVVEELPEEGEDQESDDEIEVIEESNVQMKSEKQIHETEDVIALSDDEEEDCVIINDSFTAKLNKLTESEQKSLPKRSYSPDYTSQSFIPFLEPSTSSGIRGASRQSHKTANSSHNIDDYSSTSSSNRNLYSPSVDSTSISFSSNRFDSTFVPKMDEEIPFLYNDPKPSTSSDTLVDSSDVNDIDLISECVKLERNVVKNVLNLIEDQCTVPFIVRYRQSAISGIDADKVRRINTIYNDVKKAKERAKEVEAALAKQDRLNPRLSAALNRCKNVFEVEHLYRLCRNESELSEKYRNLGLNDSAISVLEGKRLNPSHFVKRFAAELDTPEAVTEGWSAIISDIISKDCDVLEFLIGAYKRHIPYLQVVHNEKKIEELICENNPKNIELIQKYRRFESFKKPIDRINAHSYMAIERGEQIEILFVYIEYENIILNELIEFCIQKWNRCISHFLINSVRISFNNQLKPSLTDYIRWELRHSSHMKALDVFRNNVKHLLLEPPLRGEWVIGVDPGIESGCKVAVVSPWGIPLECRVLKLRSNNDSRSAAAQLRALMLQYNCSIIALGNGLGCRRFEDLILNNIKSGFFEQIDVKYKIINESGVSYYSITTEAKANFPHLKANMIGAISIARRLIDPLNELVKVDPKRLQVGMYMRDIDGHEIQRAFDEVVVECVSFCGVDVNIASIELLSKVAALEPTIARMIIEKRERDGLITSRSQLRNIDGINWKLFEQCAGFIKVMPSTRRSLLDQYRQGSKKESPNKRVATSSDDYDPLDSTIIHPESYSSANIYIELIGASKDEIGKQSIRDKIKKCYTQYSLPEIAELCNTIPINMKLIVEGLSNSIDFDYRTNFAQIYFPEIQKFHELTEGMQLKGRVMNVTPMGAFIDCGIVGGINAYLNAKECERHAIDVNDNVLVKIISIEKLLQRFRVTVVNVFKKHMKFT